MNERLENQAALRDVTREEWEAAVASTFWTVISALGRACGRIDQLESRLANMDTRVHALEHPPVTFASANGRLLGEGYRPGYPAGMTKDDRFAEASDGNDTPCGHCGRTGRQAMRPYLRDEDGSYTRLFTCPHCGHTEEG